MWSSFYETHFETWGTVSHWVPKKEWRISMICLCSKYVKNCNILGQIQSYIYQVLQTIQMKLILLCVWAEPAVLGSAKTALKFIYKIWIGYYSYTIQCMGQFISFKSEINNPWFNPWFILLHTHSNVCATVEGRCLEYLVCITLDKDRNFAKFLVKW